MSHLHFLSDQCSLLLDSSSSSLLYLCTLASATRLLFYARGDAYAASYLPEAFVCLSESIDLHRVDATRIRVPTTLVAIIEDQVVPLSDMRALRDRLAGPTRLVEISSLYGHDAFLKEGAALRRVFAELPGLGAQDP